MGAVKQTGRAVLNFVGVDDANWRLEATASSSTVRVADVERRLNQRHFRNRDSSSADLKEMIVDVNKSWLS